MLVTSGLSFVAALLAINAFVFWIVKKYPLKIYKFLPPVIIVFLIVVCCNTFGVWSFSNKAVSSKMCIRDRLPPVTWEIIRILSS